MHLGTGKLFSILLTFLAVWLAVRLLLPLFGPFVLGTILALAAEPMVRFLHRRLHVPRSAASGIAVSMLFGFLGILLLLLCALLVRELRALTGLLPQLEQAAHSGIRMTRSWLSQLSRHLPQEVCILLEDSLSSLPSGGNTFLSRGLSWLLGWAGSLLSHLPDSALGLGTAALSGCMISAKLPRLRRFLLRRIPKRRLEAIRAAWKRVRATLSCWLVAQGKLMALTAVILLLGFVLLRIPYALMWALGICLVDAFPILGTGTVLIPWSILLFLQKDTARAIGMLGIYATVTLSRSIAEPKLLGRHLGLDPLAALMALYAGYKLWGIGGMLLSPILATTALQLVPETER